ncbi:hypothetical protein DRJ16_00005 [Candidatus Woesearchaeota archaeon]|nr:MAG: hypothetical protein DRJ16_00005 [Candidatus Woesearchaeota archaeon]
MTELKLRKPAEITVKSKSETYAPERMKVGEVGKTEVESVAFYEKRPVAKGEAKVAFEKQLESRDIAKYIETGKVKITVQEEQPFLSKLAGAKIYKVTEIEEPIAGISYAKPIGVRGRFGITRFAGITKTPRVQVISTGVAEEVAKADVKMLTRFGKVSRVSVSGVSGKFLGKGKGGIVYGVERGYATLYEMKRPTIPAGVRLGKPPLSLQKVVELRTAEVAKSVVQPKTKAPFTPQIISTQEAYFSRVGTPYPKVAERVLLKKPKVTEAMIQTFVEKLQEKERKTAAQRARFKFKKEKLGKIVGSEMLIPPLKRSAKKRVIQLLTQRQNIEQKQRQLQRAVQEILQKQMLKQRVVTPGIPSRVYPLRPFGPVVRPAFGFPSIPGSAGKRGKKRYYWKYFERVWPVLTGEQFLKLLRKKKIELIPIKKKKR